MRFSVKHDDPGYQNYQALKSAGVRIDIFVDGVEVKDVSMADDLAGCLVHAVRDDKGNLTTDGENIIEQTLRGKVEIRISQPKAVEADVDGQ